MMVCRKPSRRETIMLDKSKMSKPYPAQEWRMPPLSTIWLCDDGVKRTLGEMLEGVDDDCIPQDDTDLLMLLDCFGADWTKPITTYGFMQRDEALAELGDEKRYRHLTVVK